MISRLSDIIRKKMDINQTSKNKFIRFIKNMKLRIETNKYIKNNRLIYSENIFSLLNMIPSEVTNIVSDNVCISKKLNCLIIENVETGEFCEFLILPQNPSVSINFYVPERKQGYKGALVDTDMINGNKYLIEANEKLKYICRHTLDEYIFM